MKTFFSGRLKRVEEEVIMQEITEDQNEKKILYRYQYNTGNHSYFVYFNSWCRGHVHNLTEAIQIYNRW